MDYSETVGRDSVIRGLVLFLTGSRLCQWRFDFTVGGAVLGAQLV
jgi:hypothetical protein